MANRKDYVLIPGGLNLDWQALLDDYPDDINKCYLVALDGRQLSVIHDLLSVSKWYWLWNVEQADTLNREAVLAFKYELEFCLMSGCSVQDLIKTQRMLVAALAGQSVDLESDLPSAVDFTSIGISPRLGEIDGALDTGNSQQDTNLGNIRSQMSSGQSQQHTDMQNINSRLAEIVEQLEILSDDATNENIAEKLQDVAQKVGTVATIIGAVL